jgi:two-component system LytT family response regulator
MTLRCILVEDEPLARERLAEYVQRLPWLDLRASFDNAIEALAFTKENPVDLVFLDIRLGTWSGMELLESSAIRAQVILTTAHQEYAARAYDLQVADYLLKPYTFERFVQAVERVRALATASEAPVDPNILFVKVDSRLERVRLDQILYIEGKGDYRSLRTLGKRLLTLETFGDFERRIPPRVLCRVHRSFMVALDKVESIERDRIRIADTVIPISETYRERFYALVDPTGR